MCWNSHGKWATSNARCNLNPQTVCRKNHLQYKYITIKNGTTGWWCLDGVFDNPSDTRSARHWIETQQIWFQDYIGEFWATSSSGSCGSWLSRHQLLLKGETICHVFNNSNLYSTDDGWLPAFPTAMGRRPPISFAIPFFSCNTCPRNPCLNWPWVQNTIKKMFNPCWWIIDMK